MQAALAVHRALAAAGVPHAIGGAVALGLYGAPRPTADLDVNVFAPPADWPRARAALAPLGARPAAGEWPDARHEAKLEWRGTEIHLFFADDELHAAMSAAVRAVRVEGADGRPAATLPLLAPEHLVVRKLLLGRAKDRRDVEALLVAQPDLDRTEIDRWLRRLGGAADRERN